VANEPQDFVGRAGIATKGDLAGHYVLFGRFTDPAWLLYWRDPRVSDEQMKPGKDVGDGITPDRSGVDLAMEAYGIEWLPPEESAEVIDRSSHIQNREPGLRPRLTFSSAEWAPPPGRFRPQLVG